MANTNAAGVKYLDDKGADGVCLNRSGSKASAYGSTPVAQASNITAVVTTAAVSTAPYGFTTAAQADAIVTAINSINTAIENFGITASS